MPITTGTNCIIDSTKISPTVNVIVGDNVHISDDVVIVGKGTLNIGDYVKIHRLTFINVESNVVIGHNCWIGEKSVLDGTGELTIGDNVGVGILSTIFTHAVFGDPLAGCVLRNIKCINIRSNTWLASQVSISASNVADKVVLMSGAVVLSDIQTPNTVWCGNPAIDSTDRYGVPWVERDTSWKSKRFNALLNKFVIESNVPQKIVFANLLACSNISSTELQRSSDLNVTYFDLTNHVYTKVRSQLEIKFMQFLLKHNKAKFVPFVP